MKEIILNDLQKEYLLSVAHLVWWEKQEAALNDIPFLLRQVMVYGNLQECINMEKLFPKDYLCAVLKDAPCGQMNARSWHCWHYRLLDCNLGEVPPLPARFL